MKQKSLHLAGGVREDGSVSAACFAKPRAIDLKRASWTLRPDAVTCPECRKILASRSAAS